MAQLPAMLPLIMGTIGTVGQVVTNIGSSLRNARAAEQEGKAEMALARTEEAQSRRRSAMIIGKQTAQAAAAGLDTTMGTPLEIALDSAEQAELEALNIRYQGKLSKYGRQQQAAGYRAQIPGAIFKGAAQQGEIFASPGNQSMLSDWWKRIIT